MKKSNLISVIIPTYERSKYLESAIKSVINQTYTNFEILVIDDGSKINYAQEICEKYKNCFYFYKKNGGLSSARNFGIKNAKGKFIAFLDDDDYWRKDKLQKQVEILNTDASIDLVHSSALVVDENGNSTGKTIGAADNKIHNRTGYVFWNALGIWVVKSPTPLIREKVFKEDLMFDETIKVGEDVDFYQRMFFRHKVFYINLPLAFYREYPDFKRLSLQKKQYLGIEKKMLQNFKKMKIKSCFTILKIKYKLANSAIKKNENIRKRNFLMFLLFPTYYINNYN